MPAKLPMENRFGIFMDSPFSDKPTSFQTSSKLIESDHLPQQLSKLLWRGPGWVGPSSEHPKIVEISSVWDCQVQIFLMLLGVQLGLYFVATTMTIIPRLYVGKYAGCQFDDVSPILSWSPSFLSIWGLLYHILDKATYHPISFSVHRSWLKLQWPHHDVMTLVAKGNYPNMSFISGW